MGGVSYRGVLPPAPGTKHSLQETNVERTLQAAFEAAKGHARLGAPGRPIRGKLEVRREWLGFAERWSR
jgi:hypothetical protein